jgi:hypothetical protein
MMPTISGNPGNITIQATATTPGVYFLESSVNIVNWTRIGTMELSGPGALLFLDSRVPITNMFYRIGVQLPN